MSYAFLPAMTMGVMLSPAMLVLLGNRLGQDGLAFLGWLTLAVLVMGGTVYSYVTVQTAYPGPSGEVQALRRAWGAVPAMVLPLSARLVFTTCAGTSMLAMAGYVFNEVFVLWFPNLGFSFALLGCVLLLTLLGPRMAAWAQLVGVAVVVTGLMGLALGGLAGVGVAPALAGSPALPPAPRFHSAALGLWLMLGGELAVFLRPAPQTRRLRRSMLLGIGLVWGVLCLWGLTSLQYVPRARLAEISVPHMLAARAVLGQTGRLVMGGVVLAGTCSALLALWRANANMLVGMAQHGLLPSWMAWQAARAPVPLLLLACGPAVMMAMGMAGEPDTDMFTRAGVLFWWLLYGAVHLATVRVMPRQQSRRRAQVVVSVLSSVLLGVGILALLWHEQERRHLLVFMGYVTGSLILCSVGWLGWLRFRGRSGSTGGTCTT